MRHALSAAWLAASLLVASWALPASAADTPVRYFDETQALTRAKPSLSSEGMSLLGPAGDPVRGFLVSLCAADSGQTLNGAGYLRAWMWHGRLERWMRNPSLDLEVTITGESCQTWPDKRTGYLRARRVLYASDGVLVTGTAAAPETDNKLVASIDGDIKL